MTGRDPDRPALFDRFPELAQRVPWVRLETAPSPVERLENLGHRSLWIKRDDIVSSVYGGNKVRKLEFVLADAVEKGKDRVLTIGALGTNHGLATAIFCRRMGLRCTLLLFDQPVTSYVRRNLLLAHRHGAELVYLKGVIRVGASYYLGARLRYPNTLFLYAGGSSPLGTLGAVSGALELAAQVEAGECPAPDYVICPTASNGTMAGLTLGFMLAGLPTQVIGVRVSMKSLGPLQLNTPGTVSRMIRSVHRLMASHASSVPELRLEKPVLLEGYCGEGYGVPTPGGNRALEIFREREGITLDPVYTGKTCAALLDFIESPGHADAAILYWHTYNSVDHSREAREVDYHQLPAELRQFFQGEPLRC
jgi:1-aminocyclopropane-1-carboxylate deaminase/D-cysteine desulfhydrase-like pyridoxal-dependent ACC family enzyme